MRTIRLTRHIRATYLLAFISRLGFPHANIDPHARARQALCITTNILARPIPDVVQKVIIHHRRALEYALVGWGKVADAMIVPDCNELFPDEAVKFLSTQHHLQIVTDIPKRSLPSEWLSR
jgi:hypothetical protein